MTWKSLNKATEQNTISLRTLHKSEDNYEAIDGKKELMN